VFDFGIAKTRESGASTLTQSQALLASPAYASPEQLRASKEVDERSDVWSLGVILYESVTGRAPFNGQTLPELSSEILRDAPTPPRAHRSDLSPELEGVILRCLAKEPADRFESVESLVMALEAFAPVAAKECLAYIRDLGDSTSAPPPDFDESGLGRQHHRSTLTHASVAAPADRVSPRRTNRLVLASLTGAALLGLVVAILRGRAEPVNASNQAESPTSGVLTAKPTALPEPSVPPASERVESGAERLERDSALLEPVSALSGPAPKVRSEPARKRTKPLPADASAQPKRTEPSPLETLPLNELIDGRK
jgi:serine/threonine-protein kinase